MTNESENVDTFAAPSAIRSAVCPDCGEASAVDANADSWECLNPDCEQAAAIVARGAVGAAEAVRAWTVSGRVD